jgi:hypothetical protein
MTGCQRVKNSSDMKGVELYAEVMDKPTLASYVSDLSPSLNDGQVVRLAADGYGRLKVSTSAPRTYNGLSFGIGTTNYAAGQVLSGIGTMQFMSNMPNAAATIEQILLTDTNALNSDLNLYFFFGKPNINQGTTTNIADAAAFRLGVSDQALLVATVKIAAADWVSYPAGVASANIGIINLTPYIAMVPIGDTVNLTSQNDTLAGYVVVQVGTSGHNLTAKAPGLQMKLQIRQA